MPTARVFHARIQKQPNRSLARAMRHTPVQCEKLFWRLVRGRQLAGYKFKRQVLIGNYIADFACLERKVIVELDGDQHVEQRNYDESRDAFLKAQGFRVLRFWNSELLESPEGVLEVVLAALETAPSPQSSPRNGERESIWREGQGESCPSMDPWRPRRASLRLA